MSFQAQAGPRSSSKTPGDDSLAGLVALLSSSEVEKFLSGLDQTEAELLEYNWDFWVRSKQRPPPGNWTVWLIQAGRGFGKTRTGAEWVRGLVESGAAKRIALVARTAADTRDVMVEGDAGLLKVCPPWNRPEYEPSKRRLTWPNGAIATTYTAEEPNLLRGPSHDAAWADELATWDYPKTLSGGISYRPGRGQEAWDNLMLGLRLGDDPRCIVTTTPRPVKIMRDLGKDPDCVVVRGSTYENIGNLAGAFIKQIIRKHEGSRLGRQELYAELLEEAQGALWKLGEIEAHRVKAAPPMVRVVVAIDPAVTATEESDETGIIVAGLGEDHHAYVGEDLSGKYTPDEWAGVAVKAYREYSADRVIAEVNNGGDMVESTLRTVDKNLPYKAVHASRGKRTRAEPVAALYEQGRVHHIGDLGELENQLVNWEPNSGMNSPDRLDALVWALTELMLDPTAREPGDFGLSI